jgi:flagellar biosynthesis protein FlhG
MADAYAYIKVLYKQGKIKNYQLVVNMVKDEEEGKKIYQQILYVVEKFLPEVKITLLGILPYDECVKKAIRSQIPYLSLCPDAKISIKIKEIAYKILNQKTQRKEIEFKEFLERFSNL